MMTARALRPTAAITLLTALTVAACGAPSGTPGATPGGPAGAPHAAPGTIPVAASTDVWGSVVKAVGGDAVSVSAIIDNPQKDPHGYEFTAQDVTKVTGAKFAIYNGHGYDQKFEDTLAKAGGGAIPSVNAFRVSGKPDTPDVNEHVFYDLDTVKKVADETAKDLGKIEPAKQALFLKNSTEFDAKVDQLITRAKQIGADHPETEAVVTESVADDLLVTAGITDVTPEAFAAAVEKDGDIPPAAQADTTALLTDKRVSALVSNAQTETPVTKQLKQTATAAGVPIVDVTETFPAGTTDYLAWMGKNIDGLTAAIHR